MLRPIIEIDEEKCNGCGQCILDCAEGALAIVDGKARLISDVYCDGLGACLNCPQGALSLSMREAAPFDEAAALAAKERRDSGQGKSTKPAGACPGSAARILKPLTPLHDSPNKSAETGKLMAAIPAWPAKLALVPPQAHFLKGASLLLTADCAGLSLTDIHSQWLKGRIPLLACPKLEEHDLIRERLCKIIKESAPADITVLSMSVPCCGALVRLAKEAIAASGMTVLLTEHTVQLN